ncbi:hypothetical protein MHK03_05975 [Corynebacterium simulans]|uniref:hypothetical protein n=1 Tax=Corynebacterium simulans TaxID=146827 RepID=UPI001EF3A3DF|nr:hypothetical protein [Corynebacterium simulans]MCG7247472.1 hypothetical protein [Corynebacterium simulans]
MNQPLALIASVAIAIVAAALLHIVTDWVNIKHKEKAQAKHDAEYELEERLYKIEYALWEHRITNRGMPPIPPPPPMEEVPR